ncbi:MarR family winged helix-turn-helix transcriptional regulator, partial [Chloroflexota bacterium]
IPQSELTKELNMEPHSVSELLSRMTKQGLINKIKDLEKKNQVRVEITDKGLEAYGSPPHRKTIANIMSVLTQKEKEQLWVILSKIRGSALDHLQLDKSSPFPPSNFRDI